MKAQASTRRLVQALGVMCSLLATFCLPFISCSYGFNWGDGFVTDSSIISNTGVSNPRSWFSRDRLATTLYRTVLAPHVYGERRPFVLVSGWVA